ncbi:MAG: hypothetical protein ACFFKA_03755 [Candidatus Thorarchaeota archaeon]
MKNLKDREEIYNEVIQEYSVSGITQAYAKEVSLAKDQKLIIEIAEFYPNCSVTIKILAKSTFNEAMIANSTPGSIGGLDFVYSVFGWGTTPSGGTNGATALTLPSNGLYLYIEFMGTRSGDALISWPGDYVVIVYGSNFGDPTDINVWFDITVAVDGPGDLLLNLFILVGVFLLIFYFIAAVIVILRKNYFR